MCFVVDAPAFKAWDEVGTRPHFDSSMSSSPDYNDNDHLLEGNADDAAAGQSHGGQLQNGDDAPWYAHGPMTHGAAPEIRAGCKKNVGVVAHGRKELNLNDRPHVNDNDGCLFVLTNPYGLADKDKSGSVGPLSSNLLPTGDSAPSQLHAPVHQRPQTQPPQHDGLSQYVPEWACETLPRDCLIMLLEGALKHMPQETDIVARCMRALAPLSREEFAQCFGNLSSMAPEFLAPTSSRSVCASSWAERAANESPRPAGDIPGHTSEADSNASWKHMPPAQRQGNFVVKAIGMERPCSPAKSMIRSPPLGDAAQRASSVASEARETISKAISKAGTRASIRRLTDSRVGMRVSILTEGQAIEVFQQRPAQGTERAALCSELADRYCVTTTTIYHIWDRRTWVWTNIPYWTEAEMAASLAQGTCTACKTKCIGKIQDTCEHCPINRKRGRPRGARYTSRCPRKNP